MARLQLKGLDLFGCKVMLCSPMFPEGRQVIPCDVPDAANGVVEVDTSDLPKGAKAMFWIEWPNGNLERLQGLFTIL